MQTRGFLALVLATAAVVIAAGFALSRGDRYVTPAAQGELAAPNLAARLGELAWLRLERGPMKLDFSEIGGRWVVVGKGNYPANAARMRQLLLGLAELTLVEAKTRRPELYARLDLDDPKNGKATEVVVQDRQGRVVGDLIVGKGRPDRLGSHEDGVYVRRAGEAQTWLARGAVDVTGNEAGWLDRGILDIPAARIRSMVFVGEGGVLVIGRAKAGDKFAVDNAPADAKFKSDEAIAGPAGALSGLELDDVKPAAQQKPPESGVASAAYTTFDGLTVTLKLFERDGGDWLTVAASGAGKAAEEAKAINERVQRWSYAIPAYKAKPLRTRLADLIAPAKG